MANYHLNTVAQRSTKYKSKIFANYKARSSTHYFHTKVKNAWKSSAKISLTYNQRLYRDHLARSGGLLSSSGEELDHRQDDLESKEAKKLYDNLKKGDRVIFIEDIPEEYVVKGLIAQVIEKIDTQVTVCPVFENLKDLSKRKITVTASKCVPIYYANTPILGPDVFPIFLSEKTNHFRKEPGE